MAQTKIGRIKLHLSAMKRDHKFKWHFEGILRELL
jgi:hypothetical protein